MIMYPRNKCGSWDSERRVEMKKVKLYVLCGFICALLFVPVSAVIASEIVWAPINPSFVGGNPYNASWLLSSAQAQNKHTEAAASYKQTDLMDDFENTLNRQLLSRLSTKILDEAFGEESTTPLQEGTYIVGGYEIIITTDGSINVVITDTLTGNQTTVEVPYY